MPNSTNPNNFKNRQSGEVLNSVYRNAQMAYECSNDVLKHCKDTRLFREIAAEKQRYRIVAQRAQRRLARMGITPKEPSQYSRAMAKMGIAMKTATNSRSGNIAKIMYRGTTMGIEDMQHTLNRSHSAEQAVRADTEKLLQREQQFCDNLRRYL